MQHYCAQILTAPTEDRRFRRMVSETNVIRAGMLGFAPHEDFDMHAHARSGELFYFVRGSAVYSTAGDERLDVREGDLIRVDPGEMHTFRAGADGAIVLAVVAPNLDDTVYAVGGDSQR